MGAPHFMSSACLSLSSLAAIGIVIAETFFSFSHEEVRHAVGHATLWMGGLQGKSPTYQVW